MSLSSIWKRFNTCVSSDFGTARIHQWVWIGLVGEKGLKVHWCEAVHHDAHIIQRFEGDYSEMDAIHPGKYQVTSEMHCQECTLRLRRFNLRSFIGSARVIP